MTVVDPDSWKQLVFGDETAWIDFLGTHDFWHRQLAAVITTQPVMVMPLGDGPAGEGADWHRVHQEMHVSAAAKLGIAGPPDFQSYDLSDPAQFASWTWQHAQEHIRLRQAAGI